MTSYEVTVVTTATASVGFCPTTHEHDKDGPSIEVVTRTTTKEDWFVSYATKVEPITFNTAVTTEINCYKEELWVPTPPTGTPGPPPPGPSADNPDFDLED